MSKIDVIIPTYNALNTISCTLHSIAMQSISSEITVIIANDADGLDYQNIVERFPELNIKYVANEVNKGCGGARNLGIKNGTSEYICFIDSDDQFAHPLALELMYNKIKQENADVLMSVFESEMRFSNGVAIKKMERQVTWVHSKLFRRQFLIDNNIFFKEELRLNEDMEFNQIVLDLGAKVCEIPMTTLLWRDNPNSVTHESLYKNKKSYVEAVTVYLQDCAGRKMDSSKVVLRTLQNLVVCYQYYTIVMDDTPEMENDYLQACHTYWKLAEPIVNDVDDDCFTKVYCAIMKGFKSVPVIGFTQFLKLIQE